MPFGVTVAQLKSLVEARVVNDEFNAEYKTLGNLAGILTSLKTDARTGIESEASVEERKNVFGRNEMPQKVPASYWELCWEALQDATLIMLIVSAILSLTLGMIFEHDKSTAWVEGAAILFAVVVVVNVTAGNDWVKERQFLELNATMEDEDVDIIRAGKQMSISVHDLVVGDVVELKIGDNLPADGLLTMGSGVKTDEAAMTGETELIKKTPDAPVLLSGTKMMEGTGRMVVVAVGNNSQAGIIKHLILHGGETDGGGGDDGGDAASNEGGAAAMASAGSPQAKEAAAKAAAASEEAAHSDDPTGRSVLQAKLDRLAIQIGKGGGVVAGICVLIMLIKFFVSTWPGGDEGWSDEHPSEMLSFLITGITILVVAVPEGLPLAVTLSLAFSGHRMLADNNLVKHLDACETMGSATTIASDKTGTLTTSKMTVTDAVLGGKDFVIDSREHSMPAEIRDHAPYINIISESIALNSQPTSRVEEAEGKVAYFGNPTECALIKFMQVHMDKDAKAIRAEDRYSFDDPVKAFPFSSARKRMSFIHPLAGATAPVDGETPAYRVFTKGASERVLSLCTRIVVAPGTGGAAAVLGSLGELDIVELTDERRAEITDGSIAKMAANGRRTLCLGYRDIKASEVPADGIDAISDSDVEKDLTCVCVVGILDPVRPEVPAAIERCRKAGISVMMVTGDHLATAKAIAKECGILKEGDDTYIAMEGPDFRKRVLMPGDAGLINQPEFDKIWPRLRVLARSSPQDKFTLVRGLQNSALYKKYRTDRSSVPVKIYPDRQVVAVTGDGTNDAPALSKADVGFAMGIQGTNVAKTACDIVLLNDNFTSIVQACMWGRNVYDSVAKFLQFQLTVNISAIVVASVGAIWLNHSPLKAVQMLWVNLIMDSFASLALATEPPTPDLLDRPPYGRNRPMISRQMWYNMLGQSMYQLIIILWLLANGENVDVLKINDQGRDGDHNDPPTVHYTFIFTTFVLMQIFNELNSRKLYGEYNVLSGIMNNGWFLVIVVGTLGSQILITQFGGRPFFTTGLNGVQWGYAILFGLISFPMQFVINFVAANTPQTWLAPQEFAPIEDDDEEAGVAAAASLRSATSPSRTRGASGDAAAGRIRLRARRSSSVDLENQLSNSGAKAEAEAAASVAAARQDDLRRQLSEKAAGGDGGPGSNRI